MFYYLRKAMKDAKKEKELDKKKKRLLNANMDYQFLEEIIQRVNENPNLNVRIELKDHTILDVNTKPKKQALIGGSDSDIDFMEVK